MQKERLLYGDIFICCGTLLSSLDIKKYALSICPINYRCLTFTHTKPSAVHNARQDFNTHSRAILILILERFSLKNDNDAKVKSIKESVPHIEETLQVYSARVDTLWNQICSEKSLGAIGSENVPLSKQLYQLLGPLIMVR